MSTSHIPEGSLETFWSPTPVFAYKYYLYHDVDELYYGMGRDYEIGVEHDMDCQWRNAEPRFTQACSYCWGNGTATSPQCLGEWPHHIHAVECDNCGWVPYHAPTCGFYSYKFETDDTFGHHSFPAFTSEQGYFIHLCLVRLSGTIVEHETGYKSSKLTILRSLCLPDVGQVNYLEIENDIITPMREAWQRKYYG